MRNTMVIPLVATFLLAGLVNAVPEDPAMLEAAEPRLVPSGSLFVSYKGGSPLAPPYTLFASAAGKSLNTGSSLPSDLARFDCAILNMPRAYSAADLSALQAYVFLGGNLLAIGDSASWATENGEINRISSAVGSTVRVVGGAFDPGYHVTTNVAPTTLTTGVASVMYAYFAELDPGAAGRTLLRSQDNAHALLAAQQVGLGIFIVMADVNSLSDFSSTGYTTANNRALANNLCNGLLLL